MSAFWNCWCVSPSSFWRHCFFVFDLFFGMLALNHFIQNIRVSGFCPFYLSGTFRTTIVICLLSPFPIKGLKFLILNLIFFLLFYFLFFFMLFLQDCIYKLKAQFLLLLFLLFFLSWFFNILNSLIVSQTWTVGNFWQYSFTSYHFFKAVSFTDSELMTFRNLFFSIIYRHFCWIVHYSLALF